MATVDEMSAMRRAIALAAAGLGHTNPNPSVGAVVLDSAGGIAGEGATAPAGGPHAEVAALAAAGERARGGTLVVTLEPCAHAGRTGPCTAAIHAAGIRRVVYALEDPHDVAAGGGSELSARGVEVEAGVLDDEARRDLHPWLVAARRGRPFVTWKYGATLDGRVAAADGTSRWISGPESRRDAHRLRACSDAVVVGVGTVLADDPVLTVRDWPTGRQPLRVIVDGGARTPATARVLDGAARTLIVVGADADVDRVKRLRESAAEVVELQRSDGRIVLPALLAALTERDVWQLLLEGGPTLAGSFVAARLIDRVVGYLAPTLLGDGAAVLGSAGITTIAAATRLQIEDVTRMGDDVRVTAALDDGGR